MCVLGIWFLKKEDGIYGKLLCCSVRGGLRERGETNSYKNNLLLKKQLG